MPPKVKVSGEDIINAAVELVQREGADALNARSLAGVLNCSTQPIFSNFRSMDEVKESVLERAISICNEYTVHEVESGLYPVYKASGMAYIRFAKEERELFKLLYMRDRKGELVTKEAPLFDQMEVVVQGNTGLETDKARLFHLEMWAYVHGIAVMFATGYLNLDWELVSKMLTDSYLGLKKQYETE